MTEHRGAVLMSMARLTNAQWLAVSMFEDVIDLPGRIATEPTGSALGHGSPARYHLPAAVATIGSAVGALVLASPARRRRTLGLAFAGTAVSAGVTAYLIRTVNIPLLRGTAEPSHRAHLVRRWHRINKIRLLVLLVVAVLFERAAQ